MSVAKLTIFSLFSILFRNCIQAQAQQVFVVGGLGIKGESTLFHEWAPTFERYLTETVGQQFNITFTLKYLSYNLHFDETDVSQVDLIFTTPTLFACVERKYKASALLTLLSLRKGYELDRFYGVFITQNNSKIHNLTGIVDNVVEAASPSDLGACQLQWNELMLRGMDFLNQPKQVIFSYNQKQTVRDVLSGVADIGFVRTDLVETMVADGEIDMADLRVIEDVSSQVHPEFPFPFSTQTAAPEWPLAMFPWTDRQIAKAVSEALVSLNRTHYAAVAGSYSTFIPPVSYFEIHKLQERLGFVREDGLCVSTGSYLAPQSLYDSITCPEGQVKKHRRLVEHGCELMGFPCPESDDEKTYDCLCRPCLEVPLRQLALHPVRRISPIHGEILTFQEEESYIECQKMEVCLVAEQRDLVEFEVVDNWFQFREDLGEPFLHSIHFRFGIDLEWMEVEAVEFAKVNSIFYSNGQIVTTNTSDAHSYGRVFTFNVTADTKGLTIVEIRWCKYLGSDEHGGLTHQHDGEVLCEHFDNSPILLEVVEAACQYPNQEPDNEGICFCSDGYVENLSLRHYKGGICERVPPRQWYTSFWGKIALFLICIIVLLAVVGPAYWLSTKKSESWLIDRKAIQYSDPVEVLGRGTFGLVVLGNYRNTEVAVKRVLPVSAKSKRAGSSKGGSTIKNDKSQFDFPESKSSKATQVSFSINPVATSTPDHISSYDKVSSSSLSSLALTHNRIRTPLGDRGGKKRSVSQGCRGQDPTHFVPASPLHNRFSSDDSSSHNRRTRQESFSAGVSSSGETLVTIPTTLTVGQNADKVDGVCDLRVSIDHGNIDGNDDDEDKNNTMAEVSSYGTITDSGDTLEDMDSKQMQRIMTKITFKRQSTQRFSVQRNWSGSPSKAKANDMQFVRPSFLTSAGTPRSLRKMKTRFLNSFFERSGTLQKQRNQIFLEEMKTLVYLRHPKIVTVMGAVVDGKGEPLLVMERMKNGSLYDLIHNNTMQFDGEMVMRLLSDIVAGMIFLHACDPPILHNDLKAGNVLVDDSFHTKIADFGLSAKCKSSGLLGTPYWMAPELLHGDPPSKSSDVYAFGILLFELFTRTEPYTDRVHFTLEQVLVEVADISRTEAFRPLLPEKLPGLVKDLIFACWSPNPALRPSFGMIQLAFESFCLKEVDDWMHYHCVPRLSTGNPRKGPIDSSRNSLEGEDAPFARSSTMLLHDVFPPHIARTLLAGKKVDPEHHNCVMIFFSDIVGFTDISSVLPPLKVMKMLDTLYEKFDKLARKHDIFKVETIGDAYMAVANLIKEQPQHTRNIAEFSINAIRMANSSLVCEEQPELGCVNIRVGFHSGPVVSSVVGNMNPRFCLFGDTVNTSSRMESTSLKNRIHLSDTAAALLKEHAPELELIPRGNIQVKGKGKMTTFWLEVPGIELEDKTLQD